MYSKSSAAARHAHLDALSGRSRLLTARLGDEQPENTNGDRGLDSLPHQGCSPQTSVRGTVAATVAAGNGMGQRDAGSRSGGPAARDPPRERGQKFTVTLNRASRGAAIAVGFNHEAPLVAYSYVC